MTSLIERIREDAGRRLQLPEGRTPAQELARYKEYLRLESNRLKLFHRGGADGREICQARAVVLDLLLQHVVDAVQRGLPPVEGKGETPRFALAAIGGYGRAEINPHSDIDILFLHNLDSTAMARGKVHPWLRALTEGVLYTLYDVGLKVGHATRSVEDCVAVANKDMKSKTALLEARLVRGDAELFRRMESVFLARCVRDYVDAYLGERIKDQEERRAKHGGSPSMQEPNIKNGSGGLRDYQNLLWMAFFKYRTRTLADLERRELIVAEERESLESAYEFLLRVRNELHYESGRAADVLVRAVQPKVAHSLGYTDRSPVRRLEAFMRDLYTHMRNLYIITRTLERRLALLPNPQRRLPTLRQLLREGRHRIRPQLVDGFQLVDGEICTGNARVFRDQPHRLMRVFFHAQQRGLRLHPDVAQMVRNQLELVDPAFLKDSHPRETFLEILNQRGNVAPTVRALHETGLLGRYLPEFAPLTCLVQHEFYHQYTADEHTLMCLEHLDRIWEAKDPPHCHYTEIFQSLERPFLLYLALLLHDAGKALRDEVHALAGSRLALQVAARLELDGATTHSLRLVIENHLLMAQISQRRDLDDPSVIRHFASQVQTQENLQLLTLHTLADSLGTNDKLWNGFKDSLLQRLYLKTRELLAGLKSALLVETKQRELLAAEVKDLRHADPEGREVTDEEVEAHFTTLPDRYFHVSRARDVLNDLELVRRFLRRQFTDGEDALAPIVCSQDEPDRGWTLIKVCTWDRTGLFGHITGALAAAGLNILGARIFTRQDCIILDSFTVTDARTGTRAKKEDLEKFERLLTRVLTGGEVDFADLIARRPAVPPLYQSLEGGRLPITIAFDNDTSDSCTALDLEMEDHVGLLHTITRTLASLQIDISLARVLTEKGAAVDSFYLTEAEGGKITDPDRLNTIADTLRRELSRLTGA